MQFISLLKNHRPAVEPPVPSTAAPSRPYLRLLAGYSAAETLAETPQLAVKCFDGAGREITPEPLHDQPVRLCGPGQEYQLDTEFKALTEGTISLAFMLSAYGASAARIDTIGCLAEVKTLKYPYWQGEKAHLSRFKLAGSADNGIAIFGDLRLLQIDGVWFSKGLLMSSFIGSRHTAVEHWQQLRVQPRG